MAMSYVLLYHNQYFIVPALSRHWPARYMYLLLSGCATKKMNNGRVTIYLVVFNCCVITQNSSNSIFFIDIVISYKIFATVIKDNKLFGNKRTVKYSLESVIVPIECYSIAKSAFAKRSRALDENAIRHGFILITSSLPYGIFPMALAHQRVIIIAPYHFTIAPSTQTLILQWGDSDLVSPSGFHTKYRYDFFFISRQH